MQNPSPTRPAAASEREDATREILAAIRESRDDERPVFDAVLRNAARLCNAPMAWLLLCNEAQTEMTLAGYHGLARRALKIGDTWALRVDPDSQAGLGRAILEARTTQDEDLAQTPFYLQGDGSVGQLVDEEGLRTRMSVPLVSGGRGIGAIVLSRREVAPFGPDDMALLDTFAEQAVIAIENARQFKHLQDALDKQEATSDILRVISQSREDETQVFNLILEKAAVLCAADQGGLQIVNEARTHVRLMADWGHNRTAWRPGLEFSLDEPLSVVETIRTAKVVHIEDYAQTEAYKARHQIAVDLVETEGVRTRLIVPILLDGIAVGCISLSRRAVLPFAPAEIALVETFAAQAVIAIENVRQFRELQTRLEREAATREILEVISQSRDDEAPVFDAVLRKAAQLCGAPLAGLNIISEDRSHAVMVAHWGDTLRALAPGKTVWQLDDSAGGSSIPMRDGVIFHEHDLADTDLYRAGDPTRRASVDGEGIRTFVCVPLFNAGRTIGSIALYRREVRPFTLDQIALIETFAAQAVIAIENVRQFKALEALNAELGDRVEVQVGEIERMGRLKRFLPAAVADTVISSGSDKMLSSHRALLGVLFCDIRGFTAFCETAEPEETIEVLQTYHEEMGKLINIHGAGVDHRMGDGIMVLFNDPLPCDDPAGDAVRLALAMRERMAELCKQWKRMGHRLGFGMGVSLGYATVGMVGFEGRFDYTASGTAINLASRLCDEAQDGEILLSPRARLAVEDDFKVESRGEITFKGIREPVEVFRLSGHP